jgi:hypothetical protein
MPKNPKQTSEKVAKIAGTNLPKKGLPKEIKSVIASDLAQAPLKPKKTDKPKSKKK